MLGRFNDMRPNETKPGPRADRIHKIFSLPTNMAMTFKSWNLKVDMNSPKTMSRSSGKTTFLSVHLHARRGAKLGVIVAAWHPC